MRKVLGAGVAVVMLITPAFAQTMSPGGTTAPNSGAGVAGKPGNKSGPAVSPRSGTSGAGTANEDLNRAKGADDAAKVPGMSGNKSGPAPKSPSGSSK